MLKLDHIKILLPCQFGYSLRQFRVKIRCCSNWPPLAQSTHRRSQRPQLDPVSDDSIDMLTIRFKFLRVSQFIFEFEQGKHPNPMVFRDAFEQIKVS